jgi:enoyl-CoA hydratase
MERDWDTYQNIKLKGASKLDYSDYTTVLVEIKDEIALVTMNRPEALNTFDGYLHRELGDVFEDLEKDDDVKVVILTGAGRLFSAGGDIGWMKDRLEGHKKIIPIPWTDCVRILYNIANLPKPVIAAVNGAAVGLGANLALCCDIIIATENAAFSDPHVRVGLAAGDGGCVLWPMVMSLNKAKEYLFTGDSIKATEAANKGIINKVVPADQLMPTARELAKRLAGGPSMAIAFTKMAANTELREKLNSILQSSLALEYVTRESSDHLEGARAFLEKRNPQYNTGFETDL